MKNKLNFKFYSDARHGWLAVKVELLIKYKYSPTQFSYIKGKTAYLEEDCDATRFLKILDENKILYSIQDLYHGDSSPIRNYSSIAPGFIHE